MYAALWRALPGRAWVRAAILVVAAAAIVAGLFLYVFPLVAAVLTPQDVTVG